MKQSSVVQKLAIALALACTVWAVGFAPNTETSATDQKLTTRTADLAPAQKVQSPEKIEIPTIGLTADVEAVGTDEDSNFDVPAAELVGWYKFGSTVGQAGSTVLAAHVDYNGSEGAFFDLDQLSIGDEIQVTSAGTAYFYEVTTIRSYDRVGLPTEELFRRAGSEALTLITCGGTFVPSQKAYSNNLVVVATPVQEQV